MEMNTYVTVKQSPICHQMTLEELMFGTERVPRVINYNETNTRTYITKSTNPKLYNKANVLGLTNLLSRFNAITREIREVPRETLYNTFYVSKKGKGMPYVFKRIFAIQNKYVECNASEIFKNIGIITKKILTEHPTAEDEKITKETIEACVKILECNGFKITSAEFETILKEAYRRIDAPNEELKGALHRLKQIFEESFGALYHTSAFAYVKKRSTLDAIKRHQANESRWFGKYDLSNFFGSTTVEFIMKMFSVIFPFSEVMKTDDGRVELEKALSLCVLKGVLPQGTPISPTITNIMMIPIDYKLSNALRNFNGQHYVYTRYADDFLISSKYTFKFREIEKLITDTLEEFEAPFTIKSEKTRYGSSAGSNWNLGVMLNKDNQITIGYKKKKQFQSMLFSYVKDRMNGDPWDKGDIQVLEGYRNYYHMVEGEAIDRIVEHIGKKLNVDINSLIKEDLRV